MLKSVFLVFCLFCLSCFAAFVPPLCTDLDVTNCAPYYCVITEAPTQSDPNAVKCAEDPCYTGWKTSGNTSCRTVSGTGTPVCKRTDYNFFPGTNKPQVIVCSSETNHFSDCRLTTEALSKIHLDDDDNFPAMEEYCKDLGCGGVYQYFDTNVGTNNAGDDGPNIYFHCEEPDNDGTVDPYDFDVANCKKFDFKVKGGKCDWDDCSYFDKDTCSSDCKVLDDLCVGKDVTFCGPGSWNLDGLTSDGCAAMGCGGLDVARSIRGNSYSFCLPPPPPPKKNSASYLHVSTFMLVITIFAFL